MWAHEPQSRVIREEMLVGPLRYFQYWAYCRAFELLFFLSTFHYNLDKKHIHAGPETVMEAWVSHRMRVQVRKEQQKAVPRHLSCTPWTRFWGQEWGWGWGEGGKDSWWCEHIKNFRYLTLLLQKDAESQVLGLSFPLTSWVTLVQTLTHFGIVSPALCAHNIKVPSSPKMSHLYWRRWPFYTKRQSVHC